MNSKLPNFGSTKIVEIQQPKTNKNAFSMSSHHFIYDSNFILFKFLTIVGMFPSRKNKNGGFSFSFFSVEAIYTIIILIAGSGMSLIYTSEIGYNLMNLDFEAKDKLTYSAFLAFPIIQFIPVMCFTDAKKLAQHFEDWKNYQCLYEKTTGKQMIWMKTVKNTLIRYTILLVIAVASLYSFRGRSFDELFEKYDLNKNLHLAIFYSFAYSATVLTCHSYLWRVLCYANIEAAEILLQDIESGKWKDGSGSGLMKLWLNVRELCTGVGDAMSSSMLYYCAAMFAISLPSLYVGAVTTTNGQYFQILISIGTLSSISIQSEISHKVVNAVGAKFQSRLTSLLLSGKAPDCEKQLIKFIQLVSGCPPVMSLKGFFNLDRGVNLPLFSNAATYFIIMIQFGWGTNNEASPPTTQTLD